jgi:predicted Holliday junction resolvase-like endonuclease
MWDAINNVIGKAQTELFLFLVLLTILLVVTIRPILAYLNKRKLQETERENSILKVIQGNSSVMSELKTLLKETNENCKDCKSEQLLAFKRIEDRQESVALSINDIKHEVTEVLGKVITL